MKKKLQISDDLALPLEAATCSIAILALKGKGKTYAGGVLAEEMHAAGVPVTVIDPVGAWSGLASGADGTAKGGLPIVIFGGDRADVPLEATRGEEIASLIVKEQISAVLDLSLLRKHDAQAFVGAFARRLYHENRSAMHLFIDEADWFAPQLTMRGERETLDAIADIVKLGRRRGIGSTLITQRTATLNNDVLSMCEILVALGTTFDKDVERIEGWIGMHASKADKASVLATLASLPKGTAWVWWPGQEILKKVKIRKKTTFDSSKTPEVGEAVVAPKDRAAVDLGRLRELFAQTIKIAEAQDPKRLQARVLELEAEIGALKLQGAKEPEVQVEQVPVITEEIRKEFNEALEYLRRVSDRIQEALDVVSSPQVMVAEAFPGQPYRQAAVETTAENETQGYLGAIRRAGREGRKEPPSDGSLNVQSLLDALGAHHPAPLSKEQLAAMMGVSHRTGSFAQKLAQAQRDGQVEKHAGRFNLVGGRIGAVPPAGRALVQLWRSKLEGRQPEMLDLIVAAGSAGISKEDLGEGIGVSPATGSFAQNVARLILLELAVRRNGKLCVGPALTKRTFP